VWVDWVDWVKMEVSEDVDWLREVLEEVESLNIIGISCENSESSCTADSYGATGSGASYEAGDGGS